VDSMKKSLLLLVALAALSPAALGQTDDIAFALGGLRGHLIGAVSNTIAKNGEGSTVELKDGTILHAFSRHMRPKDLKKFPNADLWPAIVAQTVSHDGGRTWSPPQPMFHSSTGDNAMQPGFVRMKNGALGVSYSLINSFSSATKVFRYSRDEGKTWSPEIQISPSGSYWTSAHDRMLLLASGRILIPLHNKKSTRPEQMVTQVAYSDDNGRSWQLDRQEITTHAMLPLFARKFGQRSAPGFWEASIAQLSGGELVMIGRTYGGALYRAVSTDDGLTWSEPVPTSLHSGAAPGRLIRIPGSDDLLVIWNSCCVKEDNNLLGPRLTLSSAISTDGGDTWKWTRTIEAVTPGNNDRVEYPAITFIQGKAFVTYRAYTSAPPPPSRPNEPMGMQEYLSILPISWFYAER
jgi:sialidase-1